MEREPYLDIRSRGVGEGDSLELNPSLGRALRHLAGHRKAIDGAGLRAKKERKDRTGQDMAWHGRREECKE